MSIARRRSMSAIAAFRRDYLADHPDRTWSDAGLAYVMHAGRQRIGVSNERALLDLGDPDDYAAFLESARALGEGPAKSPNGLNWPWVSALVRTALGV